MPFQRIPEPQMPHNIYYNQNGFSAPPMNGQHLQGAGVGPANPMSPGMSSGGIPSPGPVMSPSVRNILNLYIIGHIGILGLAGPIPAPCTVPNNSYRF